MSITAPTRNQHPEDIKAAVRKRGKTLTQLALDSGLSASACRTALLEPVPAGNRAIATFLGTPVQLLWPEWFDEHGRRRSARKKVAT